MLQMAVEVGQPGEPMKVVSVDPSLRSTGLVIVEPGRLEAARFTTKRPKLEALGLLLAWVQEIAMRERPGVVFVEDYPYGVRNTSSLTHVAETGGIVRGVFAAAGATIIEVPIQTWKSLTIGHRQKETAQDLEAYVGAVESKYHMRFGSTDEADAFLIYQAMRVLWKAPSLRSETSRRLRAELFAALKGVEDADRRPRDD